MSSVVAVALLKTWAPHYLLTTQCTCHSPECISWEVNETSALGPFICMGLSQDSDKALAM